MPEPSVSLQEQLDAQRRRVDVDQFDLTIRELIGMATRGEIIRAPEYQRKFRWDETDESRLIESLLLGFPVPSIFVATNSDGTWELVDGLQRVSTLLHFLVESNTILEELDRPGPLKLKGLEKLKAFNGFTFTQLSTPIQLHFWKRLFRVTALSDKSDYEVRFDTFERLNNGGISLSHQEVRACIFRGPFMTFVITTAAANEEFKNLLKLQRKRQNDGTTEEMIVKFFAYLNARNDFRGSVKDFLNNYTETANGNFDLEASSELFNRVVEEISRLLGGRPFLRQNVPVTPLNQLEAVMVALGEIFREGTTLVDPPDGWLEDRELIEASASGTNSRTLLNRRIARARRLLSGGQELHLDHEEDGFADDGSD